MNRGIWQATVQGSQIVGRDCAHTLTYTQKAHLIRDVSSFILWLLLWSHHTFHHHEFFFFWCHGRDLMWSHLELRREKLAVANVERKCDWRWCNVHPGVSMSRSRGLRIRGGHCLWTIMHLVKVCLSLAIRAWVEGLVQLALKSCFKIILSKYLP